MHLIIEKDPSGTIYVYRECNKHNKKVKHERLSMIHLPIEQMDIECNTNSWPNNSYMDIEYKAKK